MSGPLRELTSLSGGERTSLEHALAGMTSLEDVVRWSFARGRDVAGVVVQDEYTHDVVVPYTERLFLVFDTT